MGPSSFERHFTGLLAIRGVGNALVDPSPIRGEISLLRGCQHWSSDLLFECLKVRALCADLSCNVNLLHLSLNICVEKCSVFETVRIGVSHSTVPDASRTKINFTSVR